VGYVTLAIAKEFHPAHILGIDIDDKLVGVARKNIRHYCDESVKLVGKYPATYTSEHHRSKEFATTGRIRFMEEDAENGDEAVEGEKPTTSSDKVQSPFPDNVWFLRENYVLEADEDLEMVREEYDVILALSITKWVHLNWGDGGVRRFFRRAFQQLLPGGRFILEIQAFETYAKKSKVTEETRQNYLGVAFKPDKFIDYLLSPEVGFEGHEELGVPKAASKGFERPLLCFRKAVYKPEGFEEKKRERVVLKAKRLLLQKGASGGDEEMVEVAAEKQQVVQEGTMT